MSTRESRKRRRVLAAPFVVTTALGACGPGSGEPGPTQPRQPPATYDQNGEPIEPDAAPAKKPPVMVNPPAPGSLPDPPADGKGEVVTRDDGTCWYYETIECPANARCNPPPPMQVTCPDGD